MKKGLSILLVAAALFGFYGGATNLNDVLACKDYWEKAGEESTANMNKLEDGLNQLKENEQAYLDGQDQVADGEKTLADGEKTLADGEAQYAQGLADYAAAPGKLAAGRKKLAAGRADLAEAIVNRAKLYNVKSKIEGAEKSYQPWLQKFGKLRNDIVQYDEAGNPNAGVMYDLGAAAVGLATVNGAFDQIESAGTKGLEAANAGIAKIEDGVKGKIVDTVKAGMPEGTTDEQAKAYAEAKGLLDDDKVQAAIASSDYAAQYKAANEGKAKAENFIKIANYLQTNYSPKLLAPAKKLNDTIDDVKGATYQASALRKAAAQDDAKDGEDALNELMSDPMVINAVAAFPEDTASLVEGVKKVIGLTQNAQKSKSEYDKDYDALAPNASLGKNIGDKVAAAATAILSNKDISGKLTGQQKEALKPYMSSKSITNLPNIELLYGTMTLGTDMKDDGKGSLLDNFATLKEGATGGIGLYNDGIADGRKQLNAGEKELAKGEADYAAAPGKLADAEKQLADGRQQLADGRQQLADGKAKLAEYEDGEQQVRDGLKTLTDTEADLELKSIADRLSGDVDFDNGDNHLELDEGLAAVEIGRGYQAEDGVLITKEITARAVGTGALLGAGVLAVLAAILSFLKKNKGAGIFAILAAAAGAFGAFYGTQAGTYFSSIAGSAVGATGWVAAGILGVVALVHAIAHFTAKPEA